MHDPMHDPEPQEYWPGFEARLSELAAQADAAKLRSDPDILAVVNAWADPGPHPEFHREYQNRVRLSWPTLGIALDNLAERMSR